MGGEELVREVWRRWNAGEREPERWELELDAIEPIGRGRVTARGRIMLTGRESGLAMEQPASWLVEIRDGRISRIRNYIGPDAARDAAAQADRGQG